MSSSKCPASTIHTEHEVECPVCGQKGKLILKCRHGRLYAYVYHGHSGRKKIEHYIGPAPEPGTSTFSEFLKEIAVKKLVRLWLPADTFNKLAEEALRRKQSIEELLVSIVEEWFKQSRERKIEEAMRRMESGRSQATPQPSRSGRSSRKAGSGITSWLR